MGEAVNASRNKIKANGSAMIVMGVLATLSTFYGAIAGILMIFSGCLGLAAGAVDPTQVSDKRRLGNVIRVNIATLFFIFFSFTILSEYAGGAFNIPVVAYSSGTSIMLTTTFTIPLLELTMIPSVIMSIHCALHLKHAYNADTGALASPDEIDFGYFADSTFHAAVALIIFGSSGVLSVGFGGLPGVFAIATGALGVHGTSKCSSP
eukprot:g5164.t1